jgi:deferrochelatase/peroxidase EfeB
MTVQRGILDPNQAHLLVSTFDLAEVGVVPRRLENFWSDVSERLHDWYAPFGLTITMGFGTPLFGKLGKADVMPAGLRLMPGWDGDAFTPADAQADVIVQVVVIIVAC